VHPAGELLDALRREAVSKLIFPLQEKLKGHDSVGLRRRLESSQWLEPAALESLRLARLRALLVHAQQHVPYYQRLFARHGVDAATFGASRGLADLARLPLLTKADITGARDDLRSVQAASLARFSTGGSSGEPLVFYIGRSRVSHDVAAKWRATRWWGVDIGDPEIVLWGSPIELKAQDRLRLLRDALLRTTLLPAFDMGPARLDEHIAAIRRIRPASLIGYPSAMCRIADHAQARGIRLDDLGIRVAFSTAERLYDEQRAQITETFGCPVANGYGGRDSGFIAHECPAGGMHISAEDIIVEVVDEAGLPLPAGQSGQLVVTHLATQDYPFIRYATGDVGALAMRACPCGRGLPLLERIEGRSSDFVVAQDGTSMHGLALVYIVRELEQVRAFKIVQESLTLTRVQLVSEPPLDEATLRSIVAGFQARLGAGVHIAIEQPAAIEPEASGKFRYVVSKVSSI
jgi:phenylacetate-CoA ligase